MRREHADPVTSTLFAARTSVEQAEEGHALAPRFDAEGATTEGPPRKRARTRVAIRPASLMHMDSFDATRKHFLRRTR